MRISPLVTLSVSAVLLLLVICTDWYARLNRKAARESQDSLSELNRIADETLDSLPTIRALGAEDLHSAMYSATNNKIYNIQHKRGVALGFFCAANSGLTTAVRAVALLVGGLISTWPGSTLTAELLTEYLLYVDMVVSSALDLGVEWSSAMEALGSGERVLALVCDPVLPQTGSHRLERVRVDIEFFCRSFAYPEQPSFHVLQHVHIQCPAGKTTALVGVSGSGKSSVVNVIQSLYDLEDGIVKLDGVDLREIDLSWLRRQFGVVRQDPRLFRGTIAENIAWGMVDVSEEQIQNAARAAHADEFIRNLPRGYNDFC